MCRLAEQVANAQEKSPPNARPYRIAGMEDGKKKGGPRWPPGLFGSCVQSFACASSWPMRLKRAFCSLLSEA